MPACRCAYCRRERHLRGKLIAFRNQQRRAEGTLPPPLTAEQRAARKAERAAARERAAERKRLRLERKRDEARQAKGDGYRKGAPDSFSLDALRKALG